VQDLWGEGKKGEREEKSDSVPAIHFAIFARTA